MRVIMLASGSKGNCSLVDTGQGIYIIDTGITFNKVFTLLRKVGVRATEIKGILITHSHGDHNKYIKDFHKLKVPIYSYKDIEKGVIHQEVGLTISAFPVPHDVKNFGFTFQTKTKKLVFFYDCGYITKDIFDASKNADIIAVEANHDEEMILHTDRPRSVKDRILSDEGHLSNRQLGEFLVKLYNDKHPKILLTHMSSEANTPVIAKTTIQDIVKTAKLPQIQLYSEKLQWVGCL